MPLAILSEYLSFLCAFLLTECFRCNMGGCGVQESQFITPVVIAECCLFKVLYCSISVLITFFYIFKVIANVRTVQAFVGEERAVKSYREALLNTYKYGKKGGVAKGLGMGSLHSVLFLSWALLVWYTSVIVHKGTANGGESFTTMLNVVIAGL